MATSEPLVSIGVPVYNGERFLRQALDSLLNQSYANLEIVVCDNASTDNTGSICSEYARRDSRIRYHRNPINIGQTPNFRRALELSSGEYFMWACADDTRIPDAVQTCSGALQRNPDAVLAYGVILFKVKEQEELFEISNAWDTHSVSAAERIRAFTKGITSQCISYGLYRKTALLNVVYSKAYGQEYLLLLQLCLHGRFEYVNSPMMVYQLRKFVTHHNPMYEDAPITLKNLLTDGGLRRWKCWTVLLMGSYYLFRTRGVTLRERASGVIAHVTTFITVHYKRLAKEIVFQLFTPISWASCLGWDFARRWNSSYSLARKLRAVIFRAS